VKVNINIQDSLKEFKVPAMTGNIIMESILDEVRRVIWTNWINQAKQGLNSTREGYINGLILQDQGRFTKSIILTGQLNNMLESGAGAYDMKVGFAKSKNVKYSKDRYDKKGVLISKGGWYVTIPFRWGTPGIVGENPAFSNIMPTVIYNIAKKNNGRPIGGDQLPSPYDERGSRAKISQPAPLKDIPEYQHLYSIYEGIKRQSASYGKMAKGAYGQYVSFRRVSENSDKLSWFHKGLQARNFATKAIQNTDINLISDNALDRMLSEMGFS